MPDTVAVSRRDLEKAMRKWAEQAKAENWPPREDDERFADEADYLFGLLKDAGPSQPPNDSGRLGI